MTMLRETAQFSDLSADAPLATVRRARKAAPKLANRKPLPMLKLSDKSDIELIDLVRGGESRAFDVLVTRHQQMVTSILLRMMDLHDAQDVAQEAFVKAYRSLDSFRGDSQFATWLYRIASNTAMNHLKVRKRRSAAVHLDALDSEYGGYGEFVVDNNTPEEFVIAGELEGLLNKRLNKLKPDLRGAIMSYELDGLSYQEIADNMNCPVGTIRSRISRSREIIDHDLRVHGYDPLAQQFNGRGAEAIA